MSIKVELVVHVSEKHHLPAACLHERMFFSK